LRELRTCDPRLQDLAWIAIRFFDFTVLEGARDEARQELYFANGLTQLHWPDSRHNCPDGEKSRAFDLAPWPIDWRDENRFYALGGYLRGLAERMRIPLRWGGDWDGDWTFTDQHFHDLGHFELME
jgi:peptidoglycan L-alanyl-D-glutamate endopeptidase CwlK